MFDDKQPEEGNFENNSDSLDSNLEESLFQNLNDNFNSIDNEQVFQNMNSNENSKIDNLEDDTPVTVQPVQFASFDEEENIHGKENRNLDLLMNVNLQMSVELGRTELPFKKVLELTRGSIISLDKLAGEPVELFANGKLVAFGEVVVIEDNFGLRITSIAAPEERLRTVHEKDDENKNK